MKAFTHLRILLGPQGRVAKDTEGVERVVSYVRLCGPQAVIFHTALALLYPFTDRFLSVLYI